MKLPAALAFCAIVAAATGIAGCAGGMRLAVRSSPHDEYAASLQRAGLDQTSLGRRWQEAADTALRMAAPISSPFAETGYFPADEPLAVAYRLDLARGRRLAVEVRFESGEPGRLFVDLFRADSEGEFRRIASLDDGLSVLELEIDRTGTYVLRLQPELLRSGRFTLSERTLAALRTFPVSGMTHRAIQSQFGATRDRGTRTHEGVDIFAARGTPVVAVADGLARPDTNTLGGNVVWLRGGLLGDSYYYAHLDRWAIEGATRVREGDILGYVGNTGNARGTTPHLHFGVYDNGAIDPSSFLEPDDRIVVPPAADAGLGRLARTRARTAVREGPVPSASERTTLEAFSLTRRLGVTSGWQRVMLPDGSIGYVAANAIADAERAMEKRRIRREVAVRESPQSNAPIIEMLAANQEVDIIGRFRDFDSLRTSRGRVGWIERGD